MHDTIRGRLQEVYGPDNEVIRILYGGSVKADNVVEIFSVPSVDGALVGGASLKSTDFLPIIEAAARRS
jgi:triosephosphate isomerase